MKRNKPIVLSYLLFLVTVCSCENPSNNLQVQKEIQPQKTEIELLIERQKYILEESKRFSGFYENFIYNKYADDALNSLRIIEKVDIPNTKLSLIFYNFNLGTEIIRKTDYILKMVNFIICIMNISVVMMKILSRMAMVKKEKYYCKK